MARLKEMYKKLLEARTLYSPYGEKNAIKSFYYSRGIPLPSNNVIDRTKTNLSYGIGPEGRGSRRSADQTNRNTISDSGTVISKLVQSGALPPRTSDTDRLRRNK